MDVSWSVEGFYMLMSSGQLGCKQDSSDVQVSSSVSFKFFTLHCCSVCANPKLELGSVLFFNKERIWRFALVGDLFSETVLFFYFFARCQVSARNCVP